MTQTNKHHLADSNLSSDLPYQVANRRNLFRTIAPKKSANFDMKFADFFLFFLVLKLRMIDRLDRLRLKSQGCVDGILRLNNEGNAYV